MSDGRKRILSHFTRHKKRFGIRPEKIYAGKKGTKFR